MFWKQIAETWRQHVAKPEVSSEGLTQIDIEDGNPFRGAAPVGNVLAASPTPPFIPTNRERLSESSLHFSC